jgi:hypothetical protein
MIREFRSISTTCTNLDQLLLGSWIGAGTPQNFNGDLRSMRTEIEEIAIGNVPSSLQRHPRASMWLARYQSSPHEQPDIGPP